MCEALEPIIDKLWRHCERNALQARTVTLKIKFADFRIATRRRTGARSVASRDELSRIALDLLAAEFPMPLGVRLLGLSLSGFLREETGASGPQMQLEF
jgi:DNA polymerase-4